MTGWQWCAGAYGQCSQCQSFVEGLWRYFRTPLVSTIAVCNGCAQELSS